VEDKTFKILAIDGGGIKGLYSSTILEHLEKKYKGNISDYFDMLCGTSTGGLIALALSLKIPTKEISDIYLKNGNKIFPKKSKISNKYNQILGKGKFSDEPLKKVLNEMFKEKTLSDSNNLLCIPSYSITDARPWVFKFDHIEGDLSRDNKARYVDVALATSAAPTYFPMAEIEYYDYKQFVDGGVWANNPTLVGLIEALTYYVGKDKKFKKLKILSISSLNSTGGKPTGLKRARGFVDWRDDLFETSLIGQSLFTDYFMSKIKEIEDVSVEYIRIPSAKISPQQASLVQLDVATTDALNLIRGMGNDMGEIYKKKNEISDFFKMQKQYKIN
jgi:patatin-like phospholipase/acyl hydrolase